MKSQPRLRARAKEVALECFINPKEEFLDKVEEELEKSITPEFLEKIRSELVKKIRPPRPGVEPKPEPQKTEQPKYATTKETSEETNSKDLFSEKPKKYNRDHSL